MKHQIARVAAAIVLGAAASLAAASECEPNFNVNGSFGSGRTYATEADLDSVDPQAIKVYKDGTCDGLTGVTGGTPETDMTVTVTSGPPTPTDDPEHDADFTFVIVGDPDVMFERPTRAIELCEQCHAQPECAAYAAAVRPTAGVWAGIQYGQTGASRRNTRRSG